jgi:hypothetical protein
VAGWRPVEADRFFVALVDGNSANFRKVLWMQTPRESLFARSALRRNARLMEARKQLWRW